MTDLITAAVKKQIHLIQIERQKKRRKSSCMFSLKQVSVCLHVYNKMAAMSVSVCVRPPPSVGSRSRFCCVELGWVSKSPLTDE